MNTKYLTASFVGGARNDPAGPDDVDVLALQLTPSRGLRERKEVTLCQAFAAALASFETVDIVQ